MVGDAGRFLDFLKPDILYCPQRLQAVDVSLVTRLDSLVGQVGLELNELLLPEDE